MNEQTPGHNTLAPLKNVTAMVSLIKKAQNRIEGIPGMACYYGPAGFGKSSAALWAANELGCVLIEAGDSWTKKYFCEVLLRHFGEKPRGSIPHMVERIKVALMSANVPLLIDEADHLVNKRYIELAREIYDGTEVPVILIGEEELPQKLRRWERIHSRMLDWRGALPADRQDLNVLAGVVCPGVEIGEDLKDALYSASGGSLRRMATNLALIYSAATSRGLRAIGVSEWKGTAFHTGEAPQPRARMAS